MRKVTITEGEIKPLTMVFLCDEEGARFLEENFPNFVSENIEDPPTYHIPGPYEIALAAGTALIGTGNFETPGAALFAGWAAVPEYFSGRNSYLKEIAPIMTGTYEGSEPEIIGEGMTIGGLILPGEINSENLMAAAMQATGIKAPETEDEKMRFLFGTPEHLKGPNFPHDAVSAWVEEHGAEEPGAGYIDPDGDKAD